MGQIFCVFYAFLEIPLTIRFLKFVSNAISQAFSGLREHLQNMGMKEVTFTNFFFFGFLIYACIPKISTEI